MYWPEKIIIREVGPRDGLQNEKAMLSTIMKIALIKQLAGAGIKAIEATSFVHPRAVPQLSDAEAVLTGLAGLDPGVTVSALVGNVKGLQRALAVRHTPLREIVVVASTSEAHNRANLNCSVAGTLRDIKEICRLAGGLLQVRGTVATAFGCPYQGVIGTGDVFRIIEGMLEAGIRQIGLADTAGLGNPRQVYELVQEVKRRYPQVCWGLHLHDARGWGLASAVTGVLAGVSVLESSLGGLGGCPFLPGAAGNLATAGLVEMLGSMGIETGVDLSRLNRCTRHLEQCLGRSLST